jgi:hypothetical protein
MPRSEQLARGKPLPWLNVHAIPVYGHLDIRIDLL